MTEKKKYLKYFEIPITEAKEWDWKEYLLFTLEIFWTTIIPFIGGALLVSSRKLIWLFMLVFPIYVRFKIQRKESKENKRQRIYLK